MALAFSYIRFSSAKQELGDSLRRQLKLAQDYAQREGLVLDTHSYQDLGVSAFKSKNVVEGKLGTFISALESGRIPTGSYLLVESLDRISRDDLDVALEMFLKIIRLGVTLVTLLDGRVYSQAALKKEPLMSVLGSMVLMLRAKEESQTKSDRVGIAWEEKRSAAAIGSAKMTAMAPSWLTLSEDRKTWHVDEHKAKVVQQIFDLALTGYGTPTIARKLNAEGVPTMVRAASWTFGVVNAILKNQSVIGDYTPKKVAAEKLAQPIQGYYPAIISETKFYQVREFLSERRWVGGHNNHNVRNLFAGMSYCAECGGKMRLKSTTASKAYIQCQTSYSGGNCKQPIFPYYAAERALMSFFSDTLADLIVERQQPNPTDPRLVLTARKAELERKIETLMDALEELDSPQVRSRIAARQADVAAIDSELQKAVSPQVQRASTLEAVALLNRLKELKNLTVEERLQAQTMFKRLLTAVHFDAGQNTVTLMLDGGEDYFHIPVSSFMDKVGGNRRQPKRLGRDPANP